MKIAKHKDGWKTNVKDKKACLVIRAMNRELCVYALDFTKPFHAAGFSSKLLRDTTSMQYLLDLFILGYDWVVSIDEDAFIWDCDAVLNLMEHMKEEGYVCAGVSDSIRNSQPAMMNPFFLVLNIAALRDDFNVKDIMGCQPEVRYEPYYPLFCWLIEREEKLLYLDAKRGIEELDDNWATTVDDHLGNPFMVHCWYARDYEEKKERFEKIISYAKRKKRNEESVSKGEV